jgi:hypothetical protein
LQTFKLYPDENTADTLFNGIKYKDLPYVTIICHKNNTKFHVNAANGTKLYYTSPTAHGFLNAKKRTNVGKYVLCVNGV